MSAEKKVLLLFLSLIILMVVCVYMHLPDFMKKENISNVEDKIETIVIEKEIVETKSETINDEIKIEEETSENVENSENMKNKDNLETATDSLDKVEEIVEVEVPLIPLVTTDKRYIRINDEKNIEELSKTAQELQIKMSDYVKENPISFKRGSFNLTKNSNQTIEMIVEALVEYPNLRIEVAGHTDAIGAAKLNQSISLKRAESVSDKLVSLGIDSNRIITRGYGEDIPLVKNSAKGYSKVNRRVEFNIVEE